MCSNWYHVVDENGETVFFAENERLQADRFAERVADITGKVTARLNRFGHGRNHTPAGTCGGLGDSIRVSLPCVPVAELKQLHAR